MSIFNFFRKKQENKQPPIEEPTFSIAIQYDGHNETPLQKQVKAQTGMDIREEYVQLSTSGDNNVCPMCAQFEGKFFLINEAPKLPLCPSCSCAYMHYFSEDLPSDAVISHPDNFVLPAKCTSLFHKHQQKLYEEADINKKIRLCEADLKNLSELMEPYLSAEFPAPAELACRDLLPEFYIQLGQWKKAENTIKKCITAKAYYPDDGSKELDAFTFFQETATEIFSYIQQNPGCLQRNIYKALSYEDNKKNQLKYILRYSKQIKKIKHGNTNELYYTEK